MTAAEQAAGARRAAGLFRPGDRGILRVGGADRVRWLDGMLSNDVAGLAPGAERSGCHALLLTRQGRIVADPHVLLRDDAVWLELARAGLPRAQETLERFIVADDVEIEDVSAGWDHLALEGPASHAVLAAAFPGVPELAPDACASLDHPGGPLLVAAYGLAGPGGRQLFAPAGGGGAVADALVAACSGQGLVEGSAAALEILRIEAGVPLLGAELDEEVLPAEARLESAVSTTKGCYTGQEVVARMASRGAVSHLLVGLVFEGGEPPAPGTEIAIAEKKVGELTSACISAAAGPIGLGFVRRAHAEPDTRVRVGERDARVAALPLVAAGPG